MATVGPISNADEDGVSVIPVDKVIFPNILAVLVAFHVPANPVKFTLLQRSAAFAKNVRAYVPPVKLNDIAFAPDTTVPALTVIAVEPVLVTFIMGVPVVVYVDAPVNIAPVLFSEIVFVPNANVPVNPVIVSVWMVTLLSTVAVPAPDEALNVAVSAEPGTEAPEPPPEVADQLVVLLQLPVPPATQKRAAI
jgi:hypothetical protein